MLKLDIQADNYSELKQKAFEALGLTEGAQTTLPFTTKVETKPSAAVDTSAVEENNSLSAMAQNARPARVRRTKAEVEADRQAKNVGAKAQTVVENNFRAADEAEAIDAEETAEENILGDEAPVIDHAYCKDLLAQVIEKHGMGKAIAIIKPFGVKMIPQLAEKQLASFANACTTVISS